MTARRPEDYMQVARLHASLIDQGFLPTLGVKFLALMYEAIDACPEAVLFTRVEGERVVGFVSGTTRMGAVYRQLLIRWFRLFVALMPSLLVPRRLWRILEVMRYGHSKADPVALPDAELLSIAVDPKFRGQAHAELLYRTLMEHFRQAGQASFKIVVGAALSPAHRFYRRMGAKPVANLEVHKGQFSTVYVHEL